MPRVPFDTTDSVTAKILDRIGETSGRRPTVYDGDTALAEYVEDEFLDDLITLCAEDFGFDADTFAARFFADWAHRAPAHVCDGLRFLSPWSPAARNALVGLDVPVDQPTVASFCASVAERQLVRSGRVEPPVCEPLSKEGWWLRMGWATVAWGAFTVLLAATTGCNPACRVCPSSVTEALASAAPFAAVLPVLYVGTHVVIGCLALRRYGPQGAIATEGAI